MTQEQTRRAIQAIAETTKLLEKEMQFSPKFQKADQIAFYRRHIAKLTAAVTNGTVPEFGRA